jgi:hypothetical protein
MIYNFDEGIDAVAKSALKSAFECEEACCSHGCINLTPKA